MTKTSKLREFPSVKGIETDSRKVKNGYLFVAMKGINYDGHDFINEAIRKGASVIIGEKEPKALRIPAGVNYKRVRNARQVLGQIASEWYGEPSKKLKIIGVTGTKGKTTTSHLIYHILTYLGRKTGLVSSLMAKIGEKEEDTGFHVTTPDVISLHGFLSEMVNADCEFAVLEVSSHGIDQGRVEGITFEVGVLTNIAPEHLDYHKSLTSYRKTKLDFVKSARLQVVGGKSTKINLLPGDFNNLNADIAVRVVKALGIDEKKALEAIAKFSLPKGRLEKVENNLGIDIYIDFAHTPDSIRAVLSYLKKKTKGKLIVVFGSAGQRDTRKRPLMGKEAANFADHIILTAEDPRGEDVRKINKEIAKGIKTTKNKVKSIVDRQKAISFAIDLAQKGDTIAVLGKGHEKSINLDGSNEIPWSDRKVIEKAVKYKKRRDE